MAASLINPRSSSPSPLRFTSLRPLLPPSSHRFAVPLPNDFGLSGLLHSSPSLKSLRRPPPYLNLRTERSGVSFLVARLQSPSAAADAKVFHGQCFVVGDNIDTDQIIPAEYLTLVPSKPDEYEKLGSYALSGLPVRYGRFLEEGQNKSKYSIIIAGSNFGCGSSREHAPVALGASGVRAVVARSYARIFFRNSMSTGELYPLESEARLCNDCQTGDYITVDMERSIVINHTRDKQYALNPIGDAGPVIEAGGIFAYARKTGMIAASSP